MKDYTREYFRHDYNARVDEKIIRLMYKMGWEGYGLYWGIVELIYTGEGKIKNDVDLIAYELRADASKVASIINDCDLFYIQDGDIRSKCIDARLDERTKVTDTKRKAAGKRWDAQPMHMHSKSDANASAYASHSIVENSTVENSIVQNSNTIDNPISPSIPEADLVEAIRAPKNEHQGPKVESKGRGTGFEAQEAYTRAITLTDKFHDMFTKGGVCHFCGSPVKPPNICNCAKYNSELQKFKYKNKII